MVNAEASRQALLNRSRSARNVAGSAASASGLGCAGAISGRSSAAEALATTRALRVTSGMTSAVTAERSTLGYVQNNKGTLSHVRSGSDPARATASCF